MVARVKTFEVHYSRRSIETLFMEYTYTCTSRPHNSLVSSFGLMVSTSSWTSGKWISRFVNHSKVTNFLLL